MTDSSFRTNLSRDIKQARAGIRPFVETAYNRQRLHSALDYLSPEEYEVKLHPPVREVNPPDWLATIKPVTL